MIRPRYARRVHTLLQRAATAAFAAAVLAACSSAAGGSPSARDPGPATAPIHISSIPHATGSSSLAFPIDPYLLTRQQRAEVDNATAVLAGRCMRRFGFDYHPLPKSAGAGEITDTNAPRRYGISDAAAVATLGYHPPAVDVSAQRASAGLDEAGFQVLTGGASPQAEGVPPATTPGPAGSYHGTRIPAGGCLGQARRQLAAQGGVVGDSPLAEAVNADSLTRSMQEPQVVAVFKQWSACMAAKGYHYATPFDAGNDHRWRTATPTATEIQTATTDVACKQKTDLVGVWYAVDSALERSMISAHQQQLDAVKRGITQQMKAVAQVIGAAN